MKFLCKAGLALLLIFAAAVVAMLLCIPAEGQSVTKPQYTVTFRFKPQANIQVQPEARIYILVDASTEGEAAINAHKFISEKLTTNAAENLQFLEAQRKQ
jgi:hypothetical protein